MTLYVRPDLLTATRPERWLNALAIGFAIGFAVYVIYGSWRNYADPAGVDFVSYWTAGRFALQGEPQLAYDIAAHRAFELTVGPVSGLMPFPYPPPFLLLISPFAIAPFPLAFPLWVLLTAGLYLAVSRTLIRGPWALANPAAHVNALIGQNGFLTAGLFIGGMALLARSPFAAGAVLGLLAFKPQLSALIPLALLAGRQWKAIGGAAASVAGLTIVTAAIYGAGIFSDFLNVLPTYVRFVESGALQPHQLASVFALLRYFDVPEAAALAVHSMVAAMAAYLTWRAWWNDDENKVAVLATSSLLISPYLFPYDALLLTVPMAFLLVHRRYTEFAVVWFLAALLLVKIALPVQPPNPICLASLAALYFVTRPVREAQPTIALPTAR